MTSVGTFCFPHTPTSQPDAVHQRTAQHRSRPGPDRRRGTFSYSSSYSFSGKSSRRGYDAGDPGDGGDGGARSDGALDGAPGGGPGLLTAVVTNGDGAHPSLHPSTRSKITFSGYSCGGMWRVCVNGSAAQHKRGRTGA